jgi:hypothetical protein
MYIVGNPTPVIDALFKVDCASSRIVEFYNSSAPTTNVILPPNTFGDNDNLFVKNLYFDDSGLTISYIPAFDAYGNSVYNIFSDSFGINYGIDYDGGVTIPEIIGATFSAVFQPLDGSFKPKAMSYTEYLRSKKATDVKVIDTKPVRTASEITSSRRLGASTVFALNNSATKGSITPPIDFSQAKLHSSVSYFKNAGGSRIVGDASTFTAYAGSQAIGRLIQSGLPPTRIVQVPNIIIESPEVSQRASDFTRQVQGCKVSLGENHDSSTLTPSKFVDNTIRNTGSPACVTQSANHDIKNKASFPLNPNRPSQAGGQYALKGDAEPGKELGAYGGKIPTHLKINKPITTLCSRTGKNQHYKAGAAQDKIPYVERHHGNDLGVAPRRVPTPYVNVKFQPPHLKINRPKQMGGYVASIPITQTLLERIATITNIGVYTLNQSTGILPGETLIIPRYITLKIPLGLTLVNNGTITCQGTIDNDAMINNGTFTVTSTGTFTTTVTFKNQAGAILTSYGTINNSGSEFMNLYRGTITSNGTFNNNDGGVVSNDFILNIRGTMTNNSGALVSATGTTNIYAGATVKNYSDFSNTFLLTNNGIFINEDGGTLLNYYLFNNITGTLINNSGTIKNLDTGVLLNNNIIRNYGTIYNYNGGKITNNGSYVENGTLNNANGGNCGNGILDGANAITATGTTCPGAPPPPFIEQIASLGGRDYTLNETTTITGNDILSIPRGFRLVIPFGMTLTNEGLIVCWGNIGNYGRLTNASTFIINNRGEVINNNIFTNNDGGTVTNNGTVANDGTFTNNSGGTVTNNNDFDIYSGRTLTNNGTFTNNSGGGTVSNQGEIENNGLLDNRDTFNNYDEGVLTNDGTVTNSGTFYNNSGATVTNNEVGTITNSGSFMKLVGSTFTDNGTYTDTETGKTILFVPLSEYATFSNSVYTLDGDQTIPSNTGIEIPFGAYLTISTEDTLINNGVILANGSMLRLHGTLINAGTIVSYTYFYISSGTLTNNGTITNYGGSVEISSSGATFTNNNTFTNANGYTLIYETLINNGTINNYSQLYNGGTFINNLGATINNTQTFTNAEGSTFTNNGGIINNTGTIIEYLPLSTYATLDGDTYTPIEVDTVLPENVRVTVPYGTTLVIPESTTFTVNGEFLSQGSIENNGTFTLNRIYFGNSGPITNNSGATININGTNASSYNGTAPIVNNGIINIDGGKNFAELYHDNLSTVTNNGTINLTNNGWWYSVAKSVNNVEGTVTIDETSYFHTDVEFRNHGTITNSYTFTLNATLINDGTITNTNTSVLDQSTFTIYNYGGGTITVDGEYNVSTGHVNNADGSGACGVGTIDGSTVVEITGTTCPPPPVEVLNLSGIATEAPSNTFTLNESTTITLNQSLTISSEKKLIVPSGLLLTNNGTVICNGRIESYDITNNGIFTIESPGTFITAGDFTNNYGSILTNNGALTNDGTITNRGTIIKNTTIYNDNTFLSLVDSIFTGDGAVGGNGRVIVFEPITDYAVLDSATYTLDGNNTIPVNKGLEVPLGFTLVIPQSQTLTIEGHFRNNGTVTNSGTISNIFNLDAINGFITNLSGSTITISDGGVVDNAGRILNDGDITISSGGTLTTYGPLFNNRVSGTITNSGVFNIGGSSANSGSITNNADSTLYITYELTNNAGATITNDGILKNEGSKLQNDGTLANNGTIYNYTGATIENNATYTGTGEVNNPTVAGACGTGTLSGSSPIVRTGTACPP